MQKSNKLITHPNSAVAISITESLKPENALKNDHIHTPRMCQSLFFFQNLFHQIIGYEQFLKNKVCVLTNCGVPQLKYQHSQSCA